MSDLYEIDKPISARQADATDEERRLASEALEWLRDEPKPDEPKPAPVRQKRKGKA